MSVEITDLTRLALALKVGGLTVHPSTAKPGLKRGKVPGLITHVTPIKTGALAGKGKKKVPGLTVHTVGTTGSKGKGQPKGKGSSGTGFGGNKVPGLIVHQGATGAGTGKKPNYFLKGNTVHNVSKSTGKAKAVGHLTVHGPGNKGKAGTGVTATHHDGSQTKHPSRLAAARAIASKHRLKKGKVPGLTIRTAGKGKRS